MKNSKSFTVLPEITLPGYTGSAYYLLNPRPGQGRTLAYNPPETTPNERQTRPIVRAILCRTVEHDLAVFRWSKGSGTPLIRKKHCAWVYYFSPVGELTDTIIREIISL